MDMAGAYGGSAPDVKKDLVARGPSFSFFQVMRLMKTLFAAKGKPGGGEGLPVSFLKLKPNLSLSFPSAGISSVTEPEPGRFEVTANLLGLYGTCSPLPTFYTEELLDDEGNGEEAVRDLINVANHRLYELLFNAWTKYRSMVKILELHDKTALDRLFSLTGTDSASLSRELPYPELLLRYTGLLSMKTRSAKGLEALLTDAFGNLPFRIVQHVVRKGTIPEDQRVILGKSIRLGQTSNLGKSYRTGNGSFRIELGPLSRKDYERFIPGGKDLPLLTALTRLYLNQPLIFDIDVRMKSEEKSRTLCLGHKEGAKLGLDSWIFSGNSPREFRTRFFPDKKKAA